MLHSLVTRRSQVEQWPQTQRELGLVSHKVDLSSSLENLEASHVFDLILSIRVAIDSVNKQLLWENLDTLSSIFQIQKKENIKTHNYRIFQIIAWLEKNSDDASWTKIMQVTWELRDSQGKYVESKDTYRKPGPDMFTNTHYSHNGNIGWHRVEPCRDREILLLKVYWIDIWTISRILTSSINK